jgi:hypothetical protein
MQINAQEDRRSSNYTVWGSGGDGNEYLLKAADCGISYSNRALFSFPAIFVWRSMGSVSYPLRVRPVANSPTC